MLMVAAPSQTRARCAVDEVHVVTQMETSFALAVRRVMRVIDAKPLLMHVSITIVNTMANAKQRLTTPVSHATAVELDLKVTSANRTQIYVRTTHVDQMQVAQKPTMVLHLCAHAMPIIMEMHVPMKSTFAGRVYPTNLRARSSNVTM
jgi:hypothetical protein